LRWLTVFLSAALVMTACSGDSADESESGAAQADSAQTESNDSTDSGQTSTDSEDAGSDGNAGSDDSAPEPAVTSGEVDCDQLDTALDSAGALVGGDPTVFDSSPEQQFEEARATMLALKEQAPEIANDIDQTLAGLEAISSAYEEIGWDTDFESDPVAAVRLTQLAFSDPAVSAMITSVANIGTWIAANCAS
jgi:hypothetical protein